MKNRFIALTHFTSFRNLVKLFDSKALYTAVEREKFSIMYDGVASGAFKFSDILANGDWGEFPGVFMGAKTSYNIGDSLEDYYTFSDVVLVFSTTLMNRPDYHLNVIDNQGFITHRSFTRETLHLYPDQKEITESFIRKRGSYDGNEIVFHNNVSLDFLEEIWVRSECHKEVVKKLIPKNFRKVKISVTNVIPDKTYDRLPKTKVTESYIPKFVYPFDRITSFKHSYPKEYIYKHSVNCGLSKEEIYKFGGDDLETENLNKVISKYAPEIFFDVRKSTLVFHPPFINVEESYLSKIGI